ncbi:type III secretion system translocator chaperone SicA [Dyella sp. Tek66A03]|uniref:type III secretion system translocator chaperone SicA n=1 Tax=Dyella sp. Tek66A03 TaxID=3458298 RepID=UPI00403EEBBA
MNEAHDQQYDEQIARLLMDGIQSGAAIKDLHGISDDMLEGVYAYAHRFYVNGQLDEAETFFRFLYLYDFYNGEYALGLGAVFQMKREYQKAIDMYALAFALTKRDYRPMFHVGQCQLALKKLTVAKECFGTVADKSGDEKLVARARIYLEAIDTSQSNGPGEPECQK